MNESKITLTKCARLAMVVLAFVAALVALQAFGAEPAEAICINYPDCGPGDTEPTPPPNDNFLAAKLRPFVLPLCTGVRARRLLRTSP